jgi:predicted CopG family antitoxin
MSSSNQTNQKNIQISEDLLNALNDLGAKGESHQDIIWRLITKKRRSGTLHNKKELREKFKDIGWDMEEFFSNFDINLQSLEQALDVDDEEINTEEIRSILKGIESLCDDLDDLSLENESSK